MIVSAGDVHREVAGEGPGLLLVHGYGTWGAWWDACGYGELRQRYRVVTVDVPGHGRSPRPTDAEAYRMDDVVQLLSDVMEAEGFATFEVWGHGTGGTIGQALALTGRVTRLISGGCTLAVPREFYELWAEPLIAAADTGDWSPLYERFGTPPDPLPPFEDVQDPAALAAFLRGNPWATTAEELRATGIPILCYLGEDDMALPMGAPQADAAGATFLTVPGTVGASFTDAANVLPRVLPLLEPLD